MKKQVHGTNNKQSSQFSWKGHFLHVIYVSWWISKCSSRDENSPNLPVDGVRGTSQSLWPFSSSMSDFGIGEEKSRHIPCKAACSYDADRSWDVRWWYSTSWWRHWFSLIRLAFSFANLDFSANRTSSWSLTYKIMNILHNEPN